VSWGTQYAKLKTNLRLAANRLKLLQKKKTELAQKSRTEIAEFLLNDKEDRARIKVESIIREDFVVEAYELLEMFCELLLARFGVIQQMKEIDDGIAEAVASLLWVAPRISHEVGEFKIISAQLEQKYGKQYAETARMNQLPEPSRVSQKLIQKLSVTAPSKLLVEKYLIEIAKCAGIDFTPDQKVMRDDDTEIAKAEQNLINFMNEDQIGWSVPIPPADHPNQPPNNFPPGHNQGGGSAAFNYPPSQPAPAAPTQNAPPHPGQFHQNPPPHPGQFHQNAPPHPGQFHQNPPAYGMHPPPNYGNVPPPPQLDSHNPAAPGPNTNVPAPNQPFDNSGKSDHIYEVPYQEDKGFDYAFPEPPTDFDEDFKKGGGGSAEKKDDINFEDLAERFKKLTKKQ
jgi:vacuolar protein sorting-associated protein IST1